MLVRDSGSWLKHQYRLVVLAWVNRRHHSLAKDSTAEDFLSRALRTNPHFHIFHAEVASRTLEDIAQSHNRDLRSNNAQ